MSTFLIVQRGPEIGKRYDLQNAIVTIGRSDDNDIALDDPYVSRYHAVIKQSGSAMTIIDLGSENPVQIRDTALEPGDPYTLQNRDIIRVGQNVLCFVDTMQAPARPAASTSAAVSSKTVVVPASSIPVQPEPAQEPAQTIVNSAPIAPLVETNDVPSTAIAPGSYVPNRQISDQVLVGNEHTGKIEPEPADLDATVFDVSYSKSNKVTPASVSVSEDPETSATIDYVNPVAPTSEDLAEDKPTGQVGWGNPSYNPSGGYSSYNQSSYSGGYNPSDYNSPVPAQDDEDATIIGGPGQSSYNYNQAQYNQPQYDQAQYNQPQYNQPQYNQPQYNQQYNQPYNPQYPAYGQDPYYGNYNPGQYNQTQQPAESEATQIASWKPGEKDKTDQTAKPQPKPVEEEEVDPGDAPTTIIRIDKNKI